MTWIRIALFLDSAAAGLVRERLVQAGFRAELHSEPLVARLWFVSKRDGGVRLEVPVAESATAARLLQQWEDGTGFLQPAIRCPGCGSLRVDFPQFTEESVLTNIAMGLAAELGLIEKDFYCEDCHNTWGKPSLEPQPSRALTAPKGFVKHTK